MDRKTFLEKYLTVVGSPEAIENEDEEFIKKYDISISTYNRLRNKDISSITA